MDKILITQSATLDIIAVDTINEAIDKMTLLSGMERRILMLMITKAAEEQREWNIELRINDNSFKAFSYDLEAYERKKREQDKADSAATK